jgi:hypothetical protein
VLGEAGMLLMLCYAVPLTILVLAAPFLLLAWLLRDAGTWF